MFSLNRAQIIGNLTRDPDLRVIPSGQSVANFAVATNRRWTDKSGNQQEDTQFHEIVAWGKLGEIAQKLLSKGKKVYVEGRLQTRSWEAQDGAKRQRTEIVADNIIALSPKEPTSEALEKSFESEETAVKEEKAPEEFPIKEPAKSKDKKAASKAAEQNEEEVDLEDIPF